MNGVSVIICCYNSENRIAPVLQHLQSQVFSVSINWEIILVNNASTDKTEEKSIEQWNHNPVSDLHIVNELKPGLMHARLKGVSVAKYDIISFIDDDNWVEANWVEKVFSVFRISNEIGACGGTITAAFETEPPSWFGSFKSGYAIGEQMEETGYLNEQRGYLWGAGLSVRKNIFENIQGKKYQWILTGRKGNTLLAGDDGEICKAVLLSGYKLYYKKDLSLIHFMPSGRINEKKMVNMVYGFGFGYPYIYLFDLVIKKRSVYVIRYVLLFLDSIKSYLKYFFKRRSSLNSKVYRSYYKGIAKGAVIFFPRIFFLHKNISRLVK